MNVNEAFPSKWLKASDLQGKKIQVTIREVVSEEVSQGESKPIVHFEGKDKGLVLNKTNAMVIAASYGPETDGWMGKPIVLYSAKVNFQGQMTDALRVEVPQPMADPDDPIPF
jgi:hypothetical protein